MSARKAQTIESFVKPDKTLGVEVLRRSDIPSPTGRGRIAKMPELTVVKEVVLPALRVIEQNGGLSVAEEGFGINLDAEITRKEAKQLGIKDLASSFFRWLSTQLVNHNLKNKVEIIRRSKGTRVFLVGPVEE